MTMTCGEHISEQKTMDLIYSKGFGDKSSLDNRTGGTYLHMMPHCYQKPFNSSKHNYLERLQSQMRSWHWTWISIRISELWPYWINGVQSLSKEGYMQKRRRLKILMVPGVLTLTPFAKAEFITRGGALGELQQWADLIAAVHVLGHDVKLMEDIVKASALLSSLQSAPSCDQYDLFFADYAGFELITAKVLHKYKCRLRVVDDYGTEPAYNHRNFSQSRKMKFVVGKMSLNPKQILTYYPHTPDNSFLGFVVPPIRHDKNHTSRQNKALLYGKDSSYFRHMGPMISKILKHMEVHATIPHHEGHLPSKVINHHLMKGADYRALMEEIKVLVAAGRPVEGPGAMEAVARGVVLLQPAFKGMRKYDALRGKPTSRQLTSQVPYLEHVIGHPHVYTIDYDDLDQVDAALKQIISNEQVEPFLPREFSVHGMLERLAVLFEEQDFCRPGPPEWPPVSALQTHLSTIGDDCIQTCHNKGLVCEPAYFHQVNISGFESRKTKCTDSTKGEDIYYPAFDATFQKCISQADPLLFSCAGHNDNLIRICLCRDYIPYQVSLCKDCLKTSRNIGGPLRNKAFIDRLVDLKQQILG